MSLSVHCSFDLIKEDAVLAKFNSDSYCCTAVFYLGKGVAIHTPFPEEKASGRKFYQVMIKTALLFECCYIPIDFAKSYGLDSSVLYIK